MRCRGKGAGAAAALLWIAFWITLTVRLIAGDGGLMAAEMLRLAPPEATGLPEAEYQAVGLMTAAYLTGGTETFQHEYTDGSGRKTECFQEHEAAHMADCRDLIRLDVWVCAACGIAAAGCTAFGLCRREKREGFLRGILTGLRIFAGAAAVMLAWALADFDGLFVTFHRVAFRNDGWLLDPRTDLLIRLMPETFFITLGIRGGMRALAMPVILEAAARTCLTINRKKEKQ